MAIATLLSFNPLLRFQIDEQATAQALWKVGDIIAKAELKLNEDMIAIYRKFIGVTRQSYFIVQDFYQQSNNKRSDPFLITQEEYVDNLGILKTHPLVSECTPYNGKIIIWYENGQKKSESYYLNGKKQGLWTKWFENGRKESKVNYKDGKRHGLWTYYWCESGHKKSETRYENGRDQGPYRSWYENGQKHKEAQQMALEFPDAPALIRYISMLHGSWSGWYENGQQASAGFFQENKVHGFWTYWYENGQKESEGQYQHGKKQGLWTYWNENGDKINIIGYRDDIEIARYSKKPISGY